MVQVGQYVGASHGGGIRWERIAQRLLGAGLLAVVTLVVMAQTALAVDRYVAPNGVDGSSCLLPNNPCATIGFAVGEAAVNDHIKVAGGSYEEGYFNIVDQVTLTGGYDPTGPGGWTTSNYTHTPTILDGDQKGRLFIIANPTADGTVVEHMVLQNADATDEANFVGTGGAVVVYNASNILFYNVKFLANNVTDNANGRGGALAILNAGSVTIDRGYFLDNRATGSGGAIYIAPDSGKFINVTLQSTLIAKGSAPQGGGVQVAGLGRTNLTLRHVTVADNNIGSSPAPEAIHFAAGSNAQASSLVLNYTLLTGNATGIRLNTTLGTQVPTAGILFGLDVTTPWAGILPGALPAPTQRALSFINPAAGNYEPAAGSAAIDIAGPTNKVDILGRKRGNVNDCTPRALCLLGKFDDYGAYEHVYTAPAVRYVATNGSDSSNNCLDAALPCLTPGRAASLSIADDEIRIAQGTYAVANVACNTAILCMTDAYTVTGGYVSPNWNEPVADPAQTTLDGTDQRPGITVNYDQPDLNARALIRNLRVVNGYSLANGGGIGINTNNAGPSQNLTIRDCIVENSRGDGTGDGGGIAANRPVSLTVANCTLRNNSVPDGRGGGLSITDDQGTATYTLEDLKVYGNQANRPDENSANGGRGGGLFLEGVGLLRRSEVYSNVAAFTGGGVSTGSNDANPTIHRVILRDNTAAVGGGFSIYLTGGATVQNSLIIRNKATATQGQISGQSNVPILGGNGVHSPHTGTGKSLRLINVTIADNGGATPDAVGVQEGSRQNIFLNVIISGNPVGIQATGGGIANLTKVQIADNVTTKTAGFDPGDLTGSAPLGGAPGFVGGGNYQLLPAAVGVDAGDVWAGNTVALDGTPRPQGTGFDLGAYEIAKTKQDQTISFNPLPNRVLGAGSFTVAASASSGLPVTLASKTPAVCTLNGTTVTLVAVGTCTLEATQTGSPGFNPAPPVSRSFTVTSPGSPQYEVLLPAVQR